jgi:inner membrane protein
METQSFFDRFNQWMRRSVGLKLAMIGMLVLILLIPADMVERLIYERQGTRDGAIQEVSSKWGQSQIVTGPILNIPFKVHLKGDKGRIIEEMRLAHVLPEQLKIESQVAPEIRYRGIFEVVLYIAGVKVKGNFAPPDMGSRSITDEDIMWDDAYVSVGLTDMKGIKDNINLQWNGTTLPFNPGINDNDVVKSGISVHVPLLHKQKGTENYSFGFDLNLNGSDRLEFIPLGKETLASIQSTWPDPSFVGTFLPEKHTISSQGFQAQWKRLQLNRNYPQQWVGNAHSIEESAFGVKLVIPADQYQQTLRSAKYSSLFVLLTFLAFFFIESWSRVRLHALQYLLAGCAIIMFYLLLLSLSEHMSFNAAYWISSLCVILLLAAFGRGIFRKNRLALMVGVVAAVLYGYLFTLLQLADYALLAGTCGLFLILGFIMYLSRRLNQASE